MRQGEAALEKYVEQIFANDNEQIVEVLNAITTLERGDSDERQETRKVKITEGTNGEVTAKSIKLYNLMEMSFHDLSGLLLRGAALSLFEDTKAKIAYGVLMLIHEFYPMVSYEFGERDSKLLLVILEHGQSEFQMLELQEAFQKRFREEIGDKGLQKSLEVFVKLKVLKFRGNGKYMLREKMVYQRQH